MAVVYWIITSLLLAAGGWANWFFYRMMKGHSVWEFLDRLPVFFHNLFTGVPDMMEIVVALAIGGPIIGGLLVIIGLLSALRRRGREHEASPPEDPTRSRRDAEEVESVLLAPKLGGDPIADQKKEARSRRVSQFMENLRNSLNDVKDALGIDVAAWRKNRIRNKGEGKIQIAKRPEKLSLQSLFGKKKEVAPRSSLIATIREETPNAKVGPEEEVIFAVVEWYGVWGKAGKTGRTEAMMKKAFELKARMTQAIQDKIIQRHGNSGLLAVDALIHATAFEKGIGGYEEESAEAVEQPATEDLVDTELHQADAGDLDELADENFHDDGSEEGDAPQFQKQTLGDEHVRDILEHFPDRSPAGRGNDAGFGDAEGAAEGQEDELAEFRRAGEGGAVDILGAMGGGREWGSDDEGTKDGNTEGGTEGADGLGFGSDTSSPNGTSDFDGLPWETPAEETSPETGTDDEMPEGFPLQKFQRHSVLDEIAAEPKEGDEFTPEGSDDDLLDLPRGSSSSEDDLPDWEKSLSTSAAVEAIRLKSRGTQAPASHEDDLEEERTVSTLMASVSPNGPSSLSSPSHVVNLDEVTLDDLKERPDRVQATSTVIPQEEIEKTIRKMDRGWLRIGLGMAGKVDRGLERQFAEAGLLDLKSRNVFIPALWTQLAKVVDYQTSAYAWEHLGENPPEHLSSPRQRAEFLFDMVTAIVALAKQVPAADIRELATLKAGTEHVKWLTAGRAERLVAELKKSGAVEPGYRNQGTSAPLASLPSSQPAMVGTDDERSKMAAASMAIVTRVARTESDMTVEGGQHGGLEYSDEELVDQNAEGSPFGGAEDGKAGGDEGGTEGGVGGEAARSSLIDEIGARAEKDGLLVKARMRFSEKSDNPSPDDQRTVDLVIGSALHTLPNGASVPVGKRVLGIVVVDVPEGQWIVSRGEYGRPQLKWGGKVIDLRTNAFRLLDRFMDGKAEETRKVIVLRMDTLAMIEDGEGHQDVDAVLHALEEGIRVRTGAWENAEWRTQVVLPLLG